MLETGWSRGLQKAAVYKLPQYVSKMQYAAGNRALLEKLPLAQLFRNSPTSGKFITVLTRELHRSLSLASSIQSIQTIVSLSFCVSRQFLTVPATRRRDNLHDA
jgi:hypothetical protein